METNNYEVELLNINTYKLFAGVYSDFKQKAVSEYKFELAPLFLKKTEFRQHFWYTQLLFPNQ